MVSTVMPARSTPVAGGRRKLSQDAVLRAAWEALDRDGLAAFSMRRLAADLGVAPMTLYGYFADREALLDAVLDYGAGALVVAPSKGPWRSRLRELLALLHRQLVAHPFVVELRFRRPILNLGALHFTEAGLAILVEAGFEPDEAARAFRPLFVYAFGSAAFGAPADPALDRRRARAALASVEPEDLPTVTAAASGLVASLSGEEQFLFGLDRLLDGLEVKLARRS
jgi:TetR/AcrR family transcriptional regulator, tetracycline repressor protein